MGSAKTPGPDDPKRANGAGRYRARRDRAVDRLLGRTHAETRCRAHDDEPGDDHDTPPEEQPQ